MNHANIRISGVPNIYLTQKLLRKQTFKPSWWADYLIGWNILGRLVFACALFTFISHVLIFTHAVFEALIYSMEHQRYFLGENKFLQQFFGLNVLFWYTYPVLHILSLLVLCKNYTCKCFNHFYKIKIHKSVKSHPRNLNKSEIAIYRFEKYAQNIYFLASLPCLSLVLTKS